MSDQSMTEEEYLRACGWAERRPEAWDPPLRSSGGPTFDVYFEPIPTAKAVEAQLAEDRARLAFVLARSAVGMTWPTPHLGHGISQGHENVAVVVKPKR